MWGLAAFFYFYQFVLRVFPNVLAEDLAASFEVNAFELGTLSAFYYASYATLQIPLGILADYLGPRRLILISAGTGIIGLALFATADTLLVAKIGRFLIGAGSACAFICCLKLASVWFPPEYFTRVIGFTMIFGAIGATTGGAPLSVMKEFLDWRTTLLVVAAIGSLYTILVFTLVKDTPPGEPTFREKRVDRHTSLLQNLWIVAKDKQSWLIVLYATLTYTPMTIFGDLWGVSFLRSAFDIDKTTASSSVSMIYVGLAIGAPLFSFFASYYRPRKHLLMITSSVAAFCLASLVLFTSSLPFTLTYVLFCIAGISLGGHYINFALICERHGKEVSGTATGFSNGITMATPFLIQPFVGWILDMTWDGGIRDGVHQYTLEGFQTALMFVPIALTLSLFVAYFLKERGTLAAKPQTPTLGTNGDTKELLEAA